MKRQNQFRLVSEDEDRMLHRINSSTYVVLRKITVLSPICAILILISYTTCINAPNLSTKPLDMVIETTDNLIPFKRNDSIGIDIPDVMEEDFNQAEVSIAIGYKLTSALEISVGVESRLPRQTIGFGSSESSKNLTSKTGMPFITYQKEVTLWKEGPINQNVLKLQSNIIKSQSMYNFTTFSAKVKDLGFFKEDIAIERNQCHWFVVIKDNNPKLDFNRSEEITRPVGWIASFNITVGSTRYSSLSHPLFAAGWEVTVSILGQPCEIFHKVTSEETLSGGGASVSDYHWYWQRGTKLYGVAGVIGVAYFDSLPDRIGIKYDVEEVLKFLEETGIWEIYYMVTNDESDDIDDSDIEYILDTLVDDAIGTPNTVDHCFWYVETHGDHEFWGQGFICSSNTWNEFPNNLVYANELADWMDDLTGRDVYVFYWMAHCDGDYFGDWFWDDPDTHNNHALFWSYQPKAVAYMISAELGAFLNHTRISQKSCQWMFGPENTHTYENYDGSNDVTIKKIKYAFESDPYTYDYVMSQHNEMGNYEFCVVPNSEGWIPICRTRGEPSYEASDDCDFSVDPYMLYGYEVYPGTYNVYVGFYKRVYVPSNAAGGTNLYIEFEGRARSGYAGSTVTNLCVAIYSDDWQDRIGSVWAAVAGGTEDSGWDSYTHTFTSVPKGAYYNVFIYYNDAWVACWNQKINIKNIYIGNTQEVTDNIDNGNFESGSFSPWTTDYAVVTSSSYYVHSGSYGVRLARYVPYTYYTAYIKQDIYVSVGAIDEITFYMRSVFNQLKVTIYYSDGSSNYLTFQTSSLWVKRTISRSDLVSGTTVTCIKFERVGSSGSTTAIDDIVLTLV
ncbi:MAG: hypothetical protein ACTSPV_08410 [Candidatus Hodarchaeales archaeon]